MQATVNKNKTNPIIMIIAVSFMPFRLCSKNLRHIQHLKWCDETCERNSKRHNYVGITALHNNSWALLNFNWSKASLVSSFPSVHLFFGSQWKYVCYTCLPLNNYNQSNNFALILGMPTCLKHTKSINNREKKRYVSCIQRIQNSLNIRITRNVADDFFYKNNYISL